MRIELNDLTSVKFYLFKPFFRSLIKLILRGSPCLKFLKLLLIQRDNNKLSQMFLKRRAPLFCIV